MQMTQILFPGVRRRSQPCVNEANENRPVCIHQVNPVDVRAVGDELVVVHACNRLELPAKQGGPIEFDAVVVWRIVDGTIAEAWDIPAVHTVRTVPQSQS